MSPEQQHQHHLATCWKFKFSGPLPDWQNEKLWDCSEICVSTNPPDDSATWKIREPPLWKNWKKKSMKVGCNYSFNPWKKNHENYLGWNQYIKWEIKSTIKSYSGEKVRSLTSDTKCTIQGDIKVFLNTQIKIKDWKRGQVKP